MQLMESIIRGDIHHDGPNKKSNAREGDVEITLHGTKKKLYFEKHGNYTVTPKEREEERQFLFSKYPEMPSL